MKMNFESGTLFSAPDNSMKEVMNMLESLLKDVSNYTVPQLIERVFQQANIIGYIMNSPEKPWLMQMLNAFFNFIKDSCKREPQMSLHNMLQTLLLMQKNKIAIPLVKITATDNGVNLITAHSAKGSEYAHVFLIGCTDKIWQSKKNGNNTYTYPDNLISQHNHSDDIEESRRLFYVAITRAKTHLQVSYSLKDKDDKALTKALFVTELQESLQCATEIKALPNEELTEYLALQFMEKAQPEIALVEENYINQLLKKYSLSVTHLSNYLSCPLKFYYQNLIKVPSAKNENMVFGSAIHFALQRLFEKMKDNNGQFPGAEILVEDFIWYMQRNREAFTPESFTLKIIYGKKILPQYYETHVNTWNKIVDDRKNIRNVYVEKCAAEWQA